MNPEGGKRVIRIAIVEDDKVYQEQLTGYLHQYEQESGERFLITLFTDGDEITENYGSNFDIILMDIQMPFMDGMTAAECIRGKDSEVVIIFITSMPQFVMRGYTVDALDYVLKPISYFAFSQRIERALARMEKRKKKYLAVPVKNGVHKLDVSKITYVEVQNHDLVYHLLSGTLMTKGTLTDAEAALGDAPFFRCNKCYLVNLEHVSSVTGSDIEVGGDVIQVSRSKKKALLDALNNYINEVSK